MEQYRVYKILRGFVDVEATDEEEAFEEANEISLNDYEYTEEDTEVKKIIQTV